MNAPLRFSKNVLGELQSVITENKPAITSEKGELFLLASMPLGAIRLKIPVEEYLTYIDSLPESTKPRPAHVLPYSGKNFQIIVNAAVECRNRKTFINGKEVTLV